MATDKATRNAAIAQRRRLVAAAYQAGETLEEVAARFGVNPVTIHNDLKAAGVPRRPRNQTKPLAERFFRHVGPPTESGCTLWLGAKGRRGYGLVSKGGRSNNLIAAHRAAWVVAHGEIPDGLWVLHRCDNPPCVNVEHLFLGTHEENMADMRAKGRGAAGERAGNAKLTETQAREIRRACLAGEMTGAEAARRYGVGPMCVSRLVRGLAWSHLSE